MKNEIDGLRTQLKEKDELLQKLEASQAELVKLKNDNEDQLLEKFALLLNEKKLKIRDQQRLLASTNVDPARLEAVEETREVRAHSAGPSRKGKRKAKDPVQESGESDGGFEKMEVDEAANESEQEQAQTPDDSTADESEEEAPQAPPTKKLASHTGNTSENDAGSSSKPPPEELVPPPKRVLPFGKKPTRTAKAAPVVDGSETESDDEL